MKWTTNEMYTLTSAAYSTNTVVNIIVSFQRIYRGMSTEIIITLISQSPTSSTTSISPDLISDPALPQVTPAYHTGLVNLWIHPKTFPPQDLCTDWPSALYLPLCLSGFYKRIFSYFLLSLCLGLFLLSQVEFILLYLLISSMLYNLFIYLLAYLFYYLSPSPNRIRTPQGQGSLYLLVRSQHPIRH
jgi:hypothetical protein